MKKNSFGQWELPRLTKKEMMRFFSEAFLIFVEKKYKKKKHKNKAQ